MAEVTLTLEEYEALREMAMGIAAPIMDQVIVAPVKRKASAYSKRFGKAFKKVSKTYKKKKWAMDEERIQRCSTCSSQTR